MAREAYDASVVGRRDVLIPGLIGGALGGGSMAAFAMIWSAYVGFGPGRPITTE